MTGSTSAAGLLLLLVLVVLVVVGILLLQRLRRGAAEAGHALAAELAEDPPLRGPDLASYAGGTADVLRDRSQGALVLTRTHLLFRELSGAGLDLPLDDVEVSVADVFDGMRRLPRRSPDAGRDHLVVRTGRSTVGFLVEEPDAWRRAVEDAARGSAQE